MCPFKSTDGVGLVLLGLMGCDQPQPPSAQLDQVAVNSPVSTQSVPFLGSWELVQIITGGATVNKPSPYAGKRPTQLQFGTNGELDGTSSNNSLTGNHYTVRDSSASSLSITQTKLGETPWGYLFVSILRQVVQYRQSNDTLVLSDAQANALRLARIRN